MAVVHPDLDTRLVCAVCGMEEHGSRMHLSWGGSLRRRYNLAYKLDRAGLLFDERVVLNGGRRSPTLVPLDDVAFLWVFCGFTGVAVTSARCTIGE